MLEILKNGTRAERMYLCSRSILCFAIYYFSEYFHYKTAPFQEDMYEDLLSLSKGELKYILFLMYRESAKTSITKIFIIWCICYNKKKYINWDSYDKDNAESALFDIATALQTNQVLCRDFGQLYNKEVKDDKDPKIKRINAFITSNDIKVEAFSTGKATRGRIYKEQRPDLYVMDDIETSKTKDSIPVTYSIIKHVKEAMSGISTTGSMIFLGNYITEVGVMEHIITLLEDNPQGMIHDIALYDEKSKEISWPDKYVLTDKEAEEINQSIEIPERRKVSIESKRRDLGESDFQAEMMNNPASAGDSYFDRDFVDRMIERAKDPIETKSEVRYYFKFDPQSRYAIGADTSMGVKRDSSTAVAINFSTIPARVHSCYDNNEIAPTSFGYELKRQGENLGECLVAPEVNSESGGTVTTTLKMSGYPIDKIYRRVKKDLVTDKLTQKIGWETNSHTKPDIFARFKKDFEDGLILILDIKLLKEIRRYTLSDLDVNPGQETTRHFDLLMACVIAWAMKMHAKYESNSNDNYKQPDYESPLSR